MADTMHFVYFGPGGADVTSSGNITRITRRIPRILQKSKMDCWVAAGKMVLGYTPSATMDIWDTKPGDSPGGLRLHEDWQVQKFIKLNGLILYPAARWTLKGVEDILRTRSALMWPAGIHAVVIAGVEVNHRNPMSSKLIIYDPQPRGPGEEIWGDLVNGVAAVRKMFSDDPKTVEDWKKKGWFAVGQYFLHR